MIGRAFSGEMVGFKPVAQGHYEVYFGRYRIGDLVDAELSGLRPASWGKV